MVATLGRLCGHPFKYQTGKYTLHMRGLDVAGNVGDLNSITALVDNGPPSISLTERLWIWESGHLKVAPNHFPIASVQLTISDPLNHWSAVVMNFDPNQISFPVTWDRPFADGILAPPREYKVIAVTCDVHNFCSRAMGTIMIPEVATATQTLTPMPSATSSRTPTATAAVNQIPAAPTVVLTSALPETYAEPMPSRFPLWPLIGLLGLFIAIASASVVDPRPSALDRLRSTIELLTIQPDHDSLRANKLK